MARYRTIKPEFFSDEKLGELDLGARLLFIGLWCFCDDYGRKQFTPQRLKYEIFPSDEISLPDIERWVYDLARLGIIRLYEDDESRYLWVPHFLQHQLVDTPSHTDNPPHPDDPYTLCQCRGCRRERGEKDWDKHLNRYQRNGFKTRKVPAGTPRAIREYPGSIPTSKSKSINYSRGVEIESVGKTHTYADQSKIEPSNPQNISESEIRKRTKERRAQIEAADSLAHGIFRILRIESNPNILQALTDSIQVRARAEGMTVELAAQKIAGRAALVNREACPDSWVQWFFDSRYDYVSAGDKRLTLRGEVVRVTCGGSGCSNGWEIVSVGDRKYSRRCQDCVRVWEEA